MKRAETFLGHWRFTVLAVVSLLALCLLGWREQTHRRAAGVQAEELARQRESAAGLELALAEARGSLAAAEAALEAARTEQQTLADRATNLAAQRDHLKAENERHLSRAGEMQATLGALEQEAEAARQRSLELETAPQELREQLERARRQVGQLEDRVDELGQLLAMTPPVHASEGVSADGSVFALQGPAPEDRELPCPVYLGRRDGIILEGWLNRMEGGTLVGHVTRWHQPSSALVKGEKVFMLPTNSHEADP